VSALAAVLDTSTARGSWGGAVIQFGRIVYLCPHRHDVPGAAIACARDHAARAEAKSSGRHPSNGREQ